MLFNIAIQVLDIERPRHWTVLKVQFCLAMTVLVQMHLHDHKKKKKEKKRF